VAALRWGLLSTARINDRIIDAIAVSNRSKVTSVASRDAAKAADYAHQRGLPRSYGSYEEMLASNEVDVVYISLPNDLHTHWGVEAARAGKHALIEKPLALSSDEVLRLSSEASSAGVVIQEASMMRFHEQTRHIRSLVAEGEIGDPRFVQGSFSFTLQRPEDIRLNSNGGGSLWDLGVYPVTLFHHVLGLLPLTVAGVGVDRGTAVDMTFSAIIEYESGVLGHFATSMEAIPSWSAELVGTKGRIRIDYPWLSHLTVTSSVELTRISLPSSSTFGDGTENLVTTRRTFANINAYRNEVSAMEEMILDGRPPVFPLDESRVNIATVAALLESSRLGQRVDVGL
jgi:predicted dehydrogenase